MSALDVLEGRRDWWIETADVMDGLALLPDECVQCVVTSPPYFALRDYGVAGQIGLEPTPDEYVATMVRVFRAVKRVLRKDGTVWCNLGDSYATNPGNGRGGEGVAGGHRGVTGAPPHRSGADKTGFAGVKTKDLLGIPWMVAFALRADGWYLRSAVTWCKKSAMPESIKDRPSSATEMIFLLAKSERYFYDAEAVREEATWEGQNRAVETRYQAPGQPEHTGLKKTDKQRGHRRRHAGFNDRWDAMSKAEQQANGRNLRNYWLLGPEPYAEAHFATFPTEVPRRCIAAGTSERGCCATCGAPWRRLKEPTPEYAELLGRDWADYEQDAAEGRGHSVSSQRPTKRNGPSVTASYATTGWAPTCDHGGDPVPCVVLDPFNGAGTTGLVAVRLGRRYVGIELNPAYAEMARNRIVRDQGVRPDLAAEVPGMAQLRMEVA